MSDLLEWTYIIRFYLTVSSQPCNSIITSPITELRQYRIQAMPQHIRLYKPCSQLFIFPSRQWNIPCYANLRMGIHSYDTDCLIKHALVQCHSQLRHEFFYKRQNYVFVLFICLLCDSLISKRAQFCEIDAIERRKIWNVKSRDQDYLIEQVPDTFPV